MQAGVSSCQFACRESKQHGGFSKVPVSEMRSGGESWKLLGLTTMGKSNWCSFWQIRAAYCLSTTLSTAQPCNQPVIISQLTNQSVNTKAACHISHTRTLRPSRLAMHRSRSLLSRLQILAHASRQSDPVIHDALLIASNCLSECTAWRSAASYTTASAPRWQLPAAHNSPHTPSTAVRTFASAAAEAPEEAAEDEEIASWEDVHAVQNANVYHLAALDLAESLSDNGDKPLTRQAQKELDEQFEEAEQYFDAPCASHIRLQHTFSGPFDLFVWTPAMCGLSLLTSKTHVCLSFVSTMRV